MLSILKNHKFKQNIVSLKLNIRLLIMDVDGTLTDGKIYMGSSSELLKAFDIKDGCGIHDILPKHDILPAIITGRKSQILESRCNELELFHLYQGVNNKKEKMEELLALFGYSYSNVAYIGDDINDLPCMQKVSLIGCPADAVKEVKSIAHFVSSKGGGNGAVREFIEWLV
jgi:3-deoxy-D-manno-octulosonate 8-phosphate phosphatase (KDO 8-P phosphatase)